MKKIKNIYPKSINNYQCFGPCYDANTKVNHPVYLNLINNETNQPFCPTRHIEYFDETLGEKNIREYDVCENPTTNKNEPINLFYSDFTREGFLTLYYNINSFYDTMQWLENNSYYPMDTKIRIMNATLNVYGDKIDLFSDVFIYFFISYLNIKKKKYIYKKLSSLDTKSKNKKEIAKKYITYDNIKNFLLYFLKHKKKIKLAEYNDILKLLTIKFIIYIKKNILYK